MNKALSLLLTALATTLLLLPSCSSEEKKEDSSTPTTIQTPTEEKDSITGKYVYIDGINTIHIKRNCLSNMLRYSERSNAERVLAMSGIQFVDTCDLVIDNSVNRYCPKCIDDLVYEHLKSISERNKNGGAAKATAQDANKRIRLWKEMLNEKDSQKSENEEDVVEE